MVCWNGLATAADLILDGQTLLVVDPKGQTATKVTKSSFLMSRNEFLKATIAMSENMDRKKLLEAAGIQRETIVSQLIACQTERDVFEQKSSKRLIWAIAAGSTGIAIGVVMGVLVR